MEQKSKRLSKKNGKSSIQIFVRKKQKYHWQGIVEYIAEKALITKK